MTGAELVSRVSITEVWGLLGGPPLRNGRGKAFWRDGDGYNIRLRDDLGVWKDFVSGDRGGIYALIQRALDCDKRTALRWLADRLGVNVDQPLSPAEKRAFWEQRRRDEELKRFRRKRVAELTIKRNYYWEMDLLTSRWAIANLNNPDLANDPRWELVWLHAQDNLKGDEIQREISRIEALSLEELVIFLEECRGRKAA